MYSQAPAFGQVAYAATGYQQSALSAYSYQQPPPPPTPPVYHVDPNSFRRDFAARLAELTINSRPIIQTLSMFAQEYSRWADVVAQCLDTHIRRVSLQSIHYDIFTSLHRRGRHGLASSTGHQCLLLETM